MPDPANVSRFRVVDWARTQHYKKRTPPWIKLYQDLLTSREWVMLDDASRVLAIACMLLASRSECHDGSFMNDPDYIQRSCYLHSRPDFKPLMDVGFLEDASTALAQRYQDASPEERRGESEETRAEEKLCASEPACTGFDEFWSVYPRNENKKRAREVWARKKLGRIKDDLIADVQARKVRHKPWLAGYIPHAPTYLNGERWNDEIVEAGQSVGGGVL